MKHDRSAFTLFEVILAIALSSALLAVIGTALNLYLVRVDVSRNRVEEAQLARSVLAMIADDIRSTTIYQKQDLSAIAEIMSSATPFDVDSIDEERSESSSSSSSSGTSTSAFGGAGSSIGSGESGAAGGTASSSAAADDGTMQLGLNGSLTELYVDASRLPRRDELFGMYTGYTNAPSPESAVGLANPMPMTTTTTATAVRPGDLRTVRYFVRDGQPSDSSGLAATSLAPQLQASAGGLVRQEVSRSARVFSEKFGGSNITELGQTLIAPEVVQIEFRYFEGEQILETWDMKEAKSLPLAVEISIWMVSPRASNADSSGYSVGAIPTDARRYRQTVFLPMAELSQNSASSGAGGQATSAAGASSSSAFGSSSSSSSSTSSSSGTSSFGSP